MSMLRCVISHWMSVAEIQPQRIKNWKCDVTSVTCQLPACCCSLTHIAALPVPSLISLSALPPDVRTSIFGTYGHFWVVKLIPLFPKDYKLPFRCLFFSTLVIHWKVIVDRIHLYGIVFRQNGLFLSALPWSSCYRCGRRLKLSSWQSWVLAFPLEWHSPCEGTCEADQ